MTPCCFAGYGDQLDPAMLALRRFQLQGLADACVDAKNNADTFNRLAQKTDKSPATRANAASNAAYWGGIYQSCQTQKAADSAVAVQQQVNAAANTIGAAQGGIDWNSYLLYGGVALGAAALLYFVMRKR